MKKFAAIAALLASASFVAPASAASLIKGTILFNDTGVSATPYSFNGANANFQFEVAEPFAAGNPATPLSVTNFKYFIGGNPVAFTNIGSVNFYQVGNGGMFDLTFTDGNVINIYGTDIGSAGSVTPGFYFPPSVSSVGVNFTVGEGQGTVSATKVGAIPEPATWAMMLAGFGAIGFAMRRRQNVRVSFA